MDARRTEGLSEGARAPAARREPDESTGVDLLDRADEDVARARSARADTAWVLAEFERLRRRIGIGHRPAP